MTSPTIFPTTSSHSSNQSVHSSSQNTEAPSHNSAIPLLPIQNTTAQPSHPMQTRLNYGISKPKQIMSLLTTTPHNSTPNTYAQAVKQSHWRQAMSDEFHALQKQATWTLVQPPANTPILGCKWTFKTKLLPNGSVDKYKARLVAQGYDQQYGINYNETFSPVAKMTTIRILLTLAVN
ncbi:uncharacterized protein LOC110099886 [Dendrobium catenatum]|uniref:uncharacterized protein LOC110099886 n=1 Tax=Dendrobium catenatum TaxID=906689 RepID=UPI0009F3465D|nr:uncharacterized protein LOC110099886 [Dendrobium catenatum]